MNIALDLGSHSFRSLGRNEDRLSARQCRAVYSILPDNRSQRRLLEGARIPFAACEGSLVLLGDAAEELSRLFQVPCVDLLPGGVVPKANPVARQIISLLIDALLPMAATPSNGVPSNPVPSAETGREICCYTQHRHAVPHGDAPPHGDCGAGEPEFLARLIRLRGYVPRPLGAGMALVFAELVRETFTGIGVAVGAAGAEISVAHCGNEIMSCSLRRGGHWVDERELTATIVKELARLLAGEPKSAHLPRRMNVVCGGGGVRASGFCDLLHEQFGQLKSTLEVGEVRLAADSPYTISRGCLIHAEIEASALMNRRRSA